MSEPLVCRYVRCHIQEDRKFDIRRENFRSRSCYQHRRVLRTCRQLYVCDLVADGQVCTFAHLDAGTLRTAVLFEK